ncbi:E2F/DP family winged-helix DNA-binding domain-containing protein [Pilobolus umbonatus]|nr:E2F/DP family winged-helix DNA-binding domain-containing protein [Pilobolus umbonatus]
MMNQASSIKLPSLFDGRDALFPEKERIATLNDTTTDILPPILNSPLSPISSSSSISSFPSPNSSSSKSFSLHPSVKKGSIQSILNSGSELIAMEREEMVHGRQSYFNNSQNSVTRFRNHPYNTKTWSLLMDKGYKCNKYRRPRHYSNNGSSSKSSHDTGQVKGLRHFSRLVYERVSKKKVTNYNDVADELLHDIESSARMNMRSTPQSLDFKNIRRRVYDSLNVFMALDIITKNKKEITWLGLPSYHQDQHSSELKRQIMYEEARQKKLSQSLQKSKQENLVSSKSLEHLRKLIQRNQKNAPTNSDIQFPFILFTSNDPIEVSYSGDKHVQITMGNKYSIYPDIRILSELWTSTQNSAMISSPA